MLAITKDGDLLHTLHAGHSITTGIHYTTQIPGLVPFYEERSAMIANGHTLPTWRSVGYRERAYCVAWYRLKRAEELHTNAAVVEYQRQKARTPQHN